MTSHIESNMIEKTQGVLLFEVKQGDKVWRLYEDGRAEGFPTGSLIINHARTLIDKLRCTAMIVTTP